MIELTINGNKGKFPEGKTLLECIESVGIKLPTLCYHKALIPYGACRLCLVEVSQNGRSSIQASCTYPAINNLTVNTDTERVKKTRKIMIELLLTRCPDSEAIKQIAEEYGVKETRFEKKNDDCFLCGLCVRMCQERMGISAISFANRGSDRKVSPPFDAVSDVCQTCGACVSICPTERIKLEEVSKNKPVPIQNEFDEGLIERGAAYIPYPQAVPNKATIDERYCAHILKDECEVCKEFCEAEAIDHEQKEKKLELNVGAIILSPGFEIFDAKIKEDLGYGDYPNVVTSLEFERILSASGPFAGHVLRPSDKTEPKRIGFIQCVGSRDVDRDYCSSVCCMYATKESIIAKEHVGQDLECDVFFMDMRAFSKGFDEYYQRAKELGVQYIRCRPSSVKEIPETKNLIIEFLAENDKKESREYDLVVLSVGLLPPKATKELSEKFGIELKEYNFCKTPPFKPVESTREGVYVSGPFTEPKDIPETVMQASGAASKVLSLLKDVKGSLITTKEYPPEIDVEGQEPRIGVFVCHCGTNIAGVVSIPDVVEYAKTLPNVVYVENNLYTCSNDTQEKIKEKIKEHNLNRVVVASCTPRTHEPLFRNTIREGGLNPYLFEMANIRDQCSWVHMMEPEKATKKSKDLLRMALAKARLIEPLQKRTVPITKSALVIGGGLAGMTSAVELANQGFDVHLVEKEKELGGNLRRIHYLLNQDNPQDELKEVIEQVKNNEKIHLYTEAKIENIEGSIGNFKTKISTKGKSKEFEHGVVIVATGAQEYKPKEYLYGQDERVITQLELEQRLSTNGEWSAPDKNGIPKNVVMIQCVGSRDEERPYCSRICCSESVKNALKIKELSPDTNVYVLFRDVRTYGFRESYYTKARQQNVVFMRYDEDKKPEVSKNGDGLQVEIFDQTLEMPIEISADLVVLSTGIVADEGNEEIGKFLKVPLNKEGFFLEAHMKLRPVDFATDGVYLCGLAHSAKATEESIIQAQAAASRAATILSQDSLELEANISHVIDESCDGCAYCVEPCPYQAITLIEYMREGAVKKTVDVDETACKGCGCCMATCPKKGIFVRGFTLEQIGAQVKAALEVQ
ncbi:MAG: FAD-dependent oxidoreductase [Candidatus Aminicenantes bacterium]|nr:MAG: FAD-dependent oxidoreductase [Candidatus Aminicenantes bacterium]